MSGAGAGKKSLTKRQMFNDSLGGKSAPRRLAAAAAAFSRSIAHRLHEFAERLAQDELYYYDVISRAASMGLDPEVTTASDTTSHLNLRGGHLHGAIIPFRPESSDLKVFSQICLDQEYRPLIKLIKQRRDEVRYVIDAGANIGLTTLYLKRFYPDSTVIAIEPDEGNFAMLERTIEVNGLKDVRCVRAGLWPQDEMLEIDRGFRDHLEWSITLKRDSEPIDAVEKIKGISPHRLKKEFEFPRIDILKIDIEGGERFLFSDAATARQTLDGVRYLALEIHDEFGIRDGIERMLSDNDFVYFETGETLFGFRK